MQIYLAATPESSQEAQKFCRNLAHVAYRIGEDSVLLRQSLLLQTRGGLLCVSDRDAPFIDRPEALRDAVLRECGRRTYSGVLLDFEEAPRQDRLAFAAALGSALAASRRALYLPESYARAAQNAVLLLCTAISGGSFSQYLQESAARYGGASRLALDVQRLRMDFRLPAHSGEGDSLSSSALEALLKDASPFFSQDLCARYFTYTQDGCAHFVLFDDAGTLNQKLRLGTGMGFAAAFFMWPEVQDIAAPLFEPWRGRGK
ncbi:MAG: hypothetical protein HFG00_03360 [Oscillibacter sp.]|nr:hypothetical protein [Oscillibacter sp.]